MNTILFADDEALLRKLVRATFEDTDYRILEASDGGSALSMVRRERPDLVILDCRMPVMTGIEVARALRQDPATAGIPIVMLSGDVEAGDDELHQASRVERVLLKPFSLAALRTAVDELLGVG